MTGPDTRHSSQKPLSCETIMTTVAPARPAAAAGPLSGARLTAAETWIFDLDNTLYPADCNLFAQIDRRMGEFIARHFGIGLDEARQRQKGFFQTHGTTLRGLMVEHALNPADFLDYVHDIDLAPVAPAPHLGAALDRLPGRKVIFTNGTVAHAGRVLGRLGIADRFEAVFDIIAADYLPKPREEPYRRLLDSHGIAPAGAVMVEDMARNLVPAAALGMTTVWVPTTAAWSQPDRPGEAAHIHHTAPDLPAFLAALPDPA